MINACLKMCMNKLKNVAPIRPVWSAPASVSAFQQVGNRILATEFGSRRAAAYWSARRHNKVDPMHDRHSLGRRAYFTPGAQN